MNETILTWLIFILAFGGMVLIHEFGHFIVSRLSGVEVEEFGVGLPTPGALTLWSGKGFLLLKSGKRVEIPFNFRFPLNWNELIEREVKITVDEVKNRLIMRSIEFVKMEEPQRSATNSLELNHVYVDQNGKVVESQAEAAQPASHKIIRAGKTTGGIELTDVVAEVHPGTRFTFNWLPFGGFVRPKGENDPNVPGGLAAASPWKRLAVLFAGPMMNLFMALIIYSIIINISGGILTLQSDGNVPTQVLVSQVIDNGPAAQAGFQEGDVFVSGAGKSIQNYEDLNSIVTTHLDKPITFVVERNGNQIELIATPRMNEKEKRPMIGVGLCTGCVFKPVTTPGENIRYSLQYTSNQIYGLVTLPVQLMRGALPPEQTRLVGLKGIFDIMRQSVSNDVEVSKSASATSASGPFNRPVDTLFIIAALSISLGIFNLFPFPALDGGRIIFVLPELIFRKRVSPQLENLVHGVGMAFLLLLMIYINVMDFINPISVKIP